MLVGVIAFNVLRVISPDDSRAVGVLLVGYFFQGQHIEYHEGLIGLNQSL